MPLPPDITRVSDADLASRRMMLGGVIQDIESQLRGASDRVRDECDGSAVTAARVTKQLGDVARTALRRVKRDLARVKLEQARRGMFRTSNKLLARDIVAELVIAVAGKVYLDPKLQSVVEKARQWQQVTSVPSF